jgi:hypothetical protein
MFFVLHFRGETWGLGRPHAHTCFEVHNSTILYSGDESLILKYFWPFIATTNKAKNTPNH